MAAPGSSRARARSAENSAPRKPPRVDTAYPFRMSDMAWSSISIHRCDMTSPNRRGSEVRRFFAITKHPRAGEWISLTPPLLAKPALRPRAFSVAVCWCAVLVVRERKRPHPRHYWRGIHHDAHGQSGARHDPASSPRPTARKSYSLTADQSWGSYSLPAPTEQFGKFGTVK